jgi:hypothetical protein
MATTKTTSKDKGTPLRYAVHTRIDHDGEVYESGEEIDLAAIDAQPLLAIGAVRHLLAAPETAKK